MKIAVLCGGTSTEREISFRTSAKVANALQQKGHAVVMVDVFFGTDSIPNFSETKDFFAIADSLRSRNSEITKEKIKEYGLMGPNVFETCKAADIVFIGLHGENGEDGKIQAVFEESGIKYTGSDAVSSAIAMSKAKTKEIVASKIRMPSGIALQKEEMESYLQSPERIPVPCVMKPSNGGSSVGVLIVIEDSEYEKSLAEAFQYDDTVLIEQYIEGRELTQAVLDGQALPPVEICPDQDTWYDYINKYNGKTVEICPAEIPEDVLAEMSEKSVRFGEIVGLSVYYRIDYLLDAEGTLYALEANSLPGMTDTSLVPQEAKAIGLDYPELCEKIIEISLEKYS
ncbi:MAG: D-alanine--D-alanine ligase [Parasporobacterium sp.]|nr:D-alanine--D-alanine ligase [Parasporobacterium sp.]